MDPRPTIRRINPLWAINAGLAVFALVAMLIMTAG